MAFTVLSGGINNRTAVLIKGGSSSLSINPALIHDREASKLISNLADLNISAPNDLQKCIDVARGSQMTDDINDSSVSISYPGQNLNISNYEYLSVNTGQTGAATYDGKFVQGAAVTNNRDLVTSSIGTDEASKNPSSIILNGKRISTGN